MNRNVFLEIYNAGNENALNLLESARILCDKKYFAQAYTLAYTALEEISKSQFSADVFTGLYTEDEFKRFYRNHGNKITNIEWAYNDASSHPYNRKWVGPDIDDVVIMNPNEPLFKKRQTSLYVDIDFDGQLVSKPDKSINEEDALGIIHIVEVALYRIWEVTGEFGGHQIGTKGFMK